MQLYRGNFPYVGEWRIPDFPWSQRARVFAIAVNMATGALSPKPVQSAVVIRKLCHEHCRQCTHDGLCTMCEVGFVLVDGTDCIACNKNCVRCDEAGANRCDLGGCMAGYGLQQGSCLPCSGTHCLSCDVSQPTLSSSRATPSSQLRATSLASERHLRSLTCVQCQVGFGFAGGVCVPCDISGCAECSSKDDSSSVGGCSGCLRGFVLVHPGGNTSAPSTCAPCAAHCNGCNLLGAGHCDPEQCDLGYSLSPAGRCDSCSGHCLNCTESGPGKCDPGRCRKGYGLQGVVACSSCRVPNCAMCERNTVQCELCKEGYGLTPEQTCEACAANCKRCSYAGACAECSAGFGLDRGMCLACADQCEKCDRVGPGQCDPGGCLPGWTTSTSTGYGVTCFRSLGAGKRH